MMDKKNRLQRFFKGKYSRKDYFEVEEMFRKPEKNELKEHMERHWEKFSNEAVAEVDLSETSRRIHKRIRFEEAGQQGNSFIRSFQRIAAILIVPLILSFVAYFFLQDKKVTNQEVAFAEIQCPMGVRTKFMLPDGTTGFLNSGSTLKYAVSFSQGRHVELNGEAYFDVAHDDNNRFVVETRNLEVGVLGTQFNVVAYDSDESEEVILQKGKVEVSTIDGVDLDTLEPNEKLLLDKEARKFSVKEVEAFQFTSWTEGKLILRNEKFAEVAKRLGRWYNVDIKIEDEELFEYAFRATFTDEPLEEVLKLLKLTAPFHFKELKRNTTSNNEYEKRIVLISLDEKRQEAFN